MSGPPEPRTLIMVRAAILGSTGYTALELIKILLNHSQLELQGSARSIVSNVELLTDNGLEAPNPAKLVHALGKAGCRVPPDLLTIDDIVNYFEVSN